MANGIGYFHTMDGNYIVTSDIGLPVKRLERLPSVNGRNPGFGLPKGTEFIVTSYNPRTFVAKGTYVDKEGNTVGIEIHYLDERAALQDDPKQAPSEEANAPHRRSNTRRHSRTRSRTRSRKGSQKGSRKGSRR